LDQHPNDAPGIYPGEQHALNEIGAYRGQLRALARQLENIFETVHPCEQTFATFGHDIRNLLILACTEVEAHWRGVLLANGYPDTRFTTNDYVKLADAMRLREFAVQLPLYPWLPPIRPFEGWGQSGKPSQELDWYMAYNAVKHDRERQFDKATLNATVAAVCACAVMMWAQFGHAAFQRDQSLRAFFDLADRPKWSPEQAYIFPYDGYATGWQPQNYPL
jgi:hypothetical protein